MGFVILTTGTSRLEALDIVLPDIQSAKEVLKSILTRKGQRL